MEKSGIVVPRLEWLIGGSRIGTGYNRYFGSLGTDPLKGFIGRNVFNYSIWIEKIDAESEKENEVIKACFWLGEKSMKNTPGEEITEKEFELAEESRAEVEKWLKENAEKALN